MNTTINYNLVDGVCDGTTSIDITDALITAFVAALPSPDHTLDLVVELNGADAITISITDANPNLDNGTNTYTLTPDDIDLTDSLTDGIYNLKLVKTLTSNGSTTTEFLCVFVDCKVSCRLADHYKGCEDPLAGVLYTILTLQNNCSECSCDSQTSIYSKLNKILNETDNCDC